MFRLRSRYWQQVLLPDRLLDRLLDKLPDQQPLQLRDQQLQRNRLLDQLPGQLQQENQQRQQKEKQQQEQLQHQQLQCHQLQSRSNKIQKQHAKAKEQVFIIACIKMISATLSCNIFRAPFFMQHFQIRIVALDTPVTGMLHGVRGLDYRFDKLFDLR